MKDPPPGRPAPALEYMKGFDLEGNDDGEEDEGEMGGSSSLLHRRAQHFRRLIGEDQQGLIARLPDDLLLESFVGDTHLLDDEVVVDDDEYEEDGHSPSEGHSPLEEDDDGTSRGEDTRGDSSKKEEWYSAASASKPKKFRRRSKKNAFHAAEDAISDTEIHLRILFQCTNPVVLEILEEKKRNEDPDIQNHRVAERDAMLRRIVDDIFASVTPEVPHHWGTL